MRFVDSTFKDFFLIWFKVIIGGMNNKQLIWDNHNCFSAMNVWETIRIDKLNK